MPSASNSPDTVAMQGGQRLTGGRGRQPGWGQQRQRGCLTLVQPRLDLRERLLGGGGLDLDALEDVVRGALGDRGAEGGAAALHGRVADHAACLCARPGRGVAAGRRRRRSSIRSIPSVGRLIDHLGSRAGRWAAVRDGAQCLAGGVLNGAPSPARGRELVSVFERLNSSRHPPHLQSDNAGLGVLSHCALGPRQYQGHRQRRVDRWSCYL